MASKVKKENPSLLSILQKKNDGEKSSTAIGTYNEAPGGGTPKSGGGRGAMKKDFVVVDSKEEADAIKADNPKAKIRYNQPRDAEGKFTYNSANNKPLVDGPSRGETIPPFLIGSKLLYAIKKDSKVSHEGKVYWTGLDMSYDEFIRECQEFRPDSDIRKALKGKGGKRNKEEKEAIESKTSGFINKGEKEVLVEGDKSDFELSFKSTYQMENLGRAFADNKIGKLKNSIFLGLAEGKLKEPKAEEPGKETPTEPKVEKAKTFDVTKAKENPQAFIAENKEVFDEISKMHPKLNDSNIHNAMVTAISTGGIKDVEELKQLANKLKQKFEESE